MSWKKDARAALCCCWRWDSEDVIRRLKIARFLYLCLWIISLILTWCLKDYAWDKFADSVSKVAGFCESAANEDQLRSCAGAQIALRISFANFIFYILHAILMFNLRYQEDPRLDIQCSGWVLKVCIWAGLLVGFFYLPSEAVQGYAQFARAGSVIFLILQLILLVDFIHDTTEYLVEVGSKAARIVLAVGTFIAFGLGLAACIFAFYSYTASYTCGLYIFFCTWAIVAGIIMVAVLWIPGANEKAVLLTSGLVWLYCCFLVLGAFASAPQDQFEQCYRGSGANPKWVQAIFFFIAIFLVIYSTLDASASSRELFGYHADSFNEDHHVPYRPDFFHLIFSLASLYIAMLFSNWELSSSGQEFQIDQGWASMWVKMATSWTCQVLYVWTIIAPAIFKDRDFSGQVLTEPPEALTASLPVRYTRVRHLRSLAPQGQPESKDEDP